MRIHIAAYSPAVLPDENVLMIALGLVLVVLVASLAGYSVGRIWAALKRVGVLRIVQGVIAYLIGRVATRVLLG